MSVAPAPTRRRLALMGRVIRMADRRLLMLILATLVLSAISGAMQSLALKWIVDSAVDQSWGLAVAAAVLGAVGAGLLGSAGRATGDAEHVVTNEVGLLIDRNTLELTASMPGIDHLERPDYLDEMSLVRSGGPGLMRAIFTLTRTASLAISMASSLWLLMVVHPLLGLTPLAAVPTAFLLPRSERHVDAAKSRAAEKHRAATQLHQLYLTPGPAMELRVFNAESRLDERADRLWNDVSDIHLRGAVRAAGLSSIGWAALTAGYVAALLFAASLAVNGEATVGDVVLVSQLALLIRGNVARTADAARHAAAALRTADRFLWLEDLHSQDLGRRQTSAAPPATLCEGIRFDNVTFTYPGTERPVLDRVTLHLPAGSTVAVVGDNGAGKTSLVKLLTGMYQPTSGRILVDGTDLAVIDINAWRSRVAGTFQDFARLETLAGFTVGLGAADATTQDNWDAERVRRAVENGSARRVVDQLADGLDTPLGTTYTHGAQLSGGQWQRLAIARGMMPAAPLCLVLDEPTASLDPSAELAVYDRYSRTAAGAAERGAVTVLVSHRFSSVKMADHIFVLDHGRVVERGSHDDLIAASGRYADMYRRQASAYRD